MYDAIMISYDLVGHFKSCYLVNKNNQIACNFKLNDTHVT